jgi:hypothetical protein
MFRRKSAAVIALATLWFTPVSAQRTTYPPQAETPSSRFVTYRGDQFEIRFPDNWVVNETGDTVTLSPQDGNISGTLAYGLVADIFNPRRNAGESLNAVPQEGEAGQITLATATDQLLDDLRRTHANLRVLRRVPKDVGGQRALEVEMSNASPVGGLEVDRLFSVLRPNGVLYFLVVAPEADANRYGPIFSRMIASIRLYN